MVRNRKHRSLYEVIRASQLKPRISRKLRRAANSDTGEEDDKSPEQVENAGFGWPRRPRALQFNAGRVEISVSYEVALVVLLVIVLVAIAAFRLGQLYGQNADMAVSEAGTADSTPAMVSVLDDIGIEAMAPIVEDRPRPVEIIAKPAIIEPIKDHRIVIQQYQVYADLVPVQKYFLQNGIATEIKERGNWYFLLSRDGFENPQRVGTDGYLIKQRIVEIGAGYRAPAGYESFAPSLFSDAYGEKIR